MLEFENTIRIDRPVDEVFERMDRATLNKSTFKLHKVNRNGTTTQIRAVSVSSTTDGLKATLNPGSTLLARQHAAG